MASRKSKSSSTSKSTSPKGNKRVERCIAPDCNYQGIDLRKHLRRKHPELAGRDPTCPICSREFACTLSLMLHTTAQHDVAQIADHIRGVEVASKRVKPSSPTAEAPRMGGKLPMPLPIPGSHARPGQLPPPPVLNPNIGTPYATTTAAAASLPYQDTDSNAPARVRQRWTASPPSSEVASGTAEYV